MTKLPSLSIVLLLVTSLAACGRETKPDTGFGTNAGKSGTGAGGGTGGTTGGGGGGSGGGGTSVSMSSGGNGGGGGSTGGTTGGGGGGTGGIKMPDGGAGTGGATNGGGGTGGAMDGGGGDSGVDAGPCPQGCSGNTPVCETSTNTCVQCLVKTDCTGNQVCSSDHTCVACNENADCTDPTLARCDTTAHACVSCTMDGQCTRFSATPVCDEGKGKCVFCTADTEQAQCGSKSCKTSTGTCTSHVRGTLLACEACEGDHDCGGGMACVEQKWGSGPSVSLGTFCFPDKTGSGGACADSSHTLLRPYSQSVIATSVDGVASTYCEPITSCQAVADAMLNGASGGKNCLTSGTPDSTVCGVANVDDGVCIADGSANQGKCSYACASDFDCPSAGAFVHCNGPSSVTKFCQP
jgi:hypothetical protein